MVSVNQNLQAALRYAEKGYPVIAVWQLRGKACACPKGPACPTPGKHPIQHGWTGKATTNVERIRTLFDKYPDAHVGILPPPGHVIIDIDPRNGGKDTWCLVMGGGMLPTPIQRSGGGGVHLVFKGPAAPSIGKGIDVKRSGRGFVVAWPSGHVSGGQYHWRRGHAPWEIDPIPLPLPRALRRVIEPAVRATRQRPKHTADEIREALTYLSAEDYELWIKVGQALKLAFGDEEGRQLWLEWSQTSEKWQEADASRWDGFDKNRDRPLWTDESIYRMARRKGMRVGGGEFEAFHVESKAIGEGEVEELHHPGLYTLDEMLEDAVYISEGSQVALRDDPRLVWSFADFESMTAASRAEVQGKERPQGVARLWLQHDERVTVHTRTFRAGGAFICQSPDDVKALNTWREPPRMTPPIDWKERAQPFIEHIKFLVPDLQDRRFFADWLAHIEQAPGVLPHIHVLMVATRHGIGRNWLASVLARVWAGVTALDVDLPQLLEGGFNGRLSRKILAVVNEIHEGGGTRLAYRHADRLKGLLTDERRRVNPKFGREYDEVNAVRWLMFSNHENALPLDRFDRRVYAIQNPDTPKSASYYANLYALAADPSFIASVREVLRTRDVGRFNPGMHAPLTSMKKKVINAAMSEADKFMVELVEDYPSDCITTFAIREYVEEGLSGISAAALPHIAGRAGARSYPRKVWINSDRGQCRVWILRNHEDWLVAAPNAIAAEVLRGEDARKP